MGWGMEWCWVGHSQRSSKDNKDLLPHSNRTLTLPSSFYHNYRTNPPIA